MKRCANLDSTESGEVTDSMSSEEDNEDIALRMDALRSMSNALSSPGSRNYDISSDIRQSYEGEILGNLAFYAEDTKRKRIRRFRTVIDYLHGCNEVYEPLDEEKLSGAATRDYEPMSCPFSNAVKPDEHDFDVIADPNSNHVRMFPSFAPRCWDNDLRLLSRSVIDYFHGKPPNFFDSATADVDERFRQESVLLKFSADTDFRTEQPEYFPFCKEVLNDADTANIMLADSSKVNGRKRKRRRRRRRRRGLKQFENETKDITDDSLLIELRQKAIMTMKRSSGRCDVFLEHDTENALQIMTQKHNGISVQDKEEGTPKEFAKESSHHTTCTPSGTEYQETKIDDPKTLKKPSFLESECCENQQENANRESELTCRLSQVSAESDFVPRIKTRLENIPQIIIELNNDSESDDDGERPENLENSDQISCRVDSSISEGNSYLLKQPPIYEKIIRTKRELLQARNEKSETAKKLCDITKDLDAKQTLIKRLSTMVKDFKIKIDNLQKRKAIKEKVLEKQNKKLLALRTEAEKLNGKYSEVERLVNSLDKQVEELNQCAKKDYISSIKAMFPDSKCDEDFLYFIQNCSPAAMAFGKELCTQGSAARIKDQCEQISDAISSHLKPFICFVFHHTEASLLLPLKLQDKVMLLMSDNTENMESIQLPFSTSALYESPLFHFRSFRRSFSKNCKPSGSSSRYIRIDPNVELCRYYLFGSCSDVYCKNQHLCPASEPPIDNPVEIASNESADTNHTSEKWDINFDKNVSTCANLVFFKDKENRDKENNVELPRYFEDTTASPLYDYDLISNPNDVELWSQAVHAFTKTSGYDANVALHVLSRALEFNPKATSLWKMYLNILFALDASEEIVNRACNIALKWSTDYEIFWKIAHKNPSFIASYYTVLMDHMLTSNCSFVWMIIAFYAYTTRSKKFILDEIRRPEVFESLTVQNLIFLLLSNLHLALFNDFPIFYHLIPLEAQLSAYQHGFIINFEDITEFSGSAGNTAMNLFKTAKTLICQKLDELGDGMSANCLAYNYNVFKYLCFSEKLNEEFCNLLMINEGNPYLSSLILLSTSDITRLKCEDSLDVQNFLSNMCTSPKLVYFTISTMIYLHVRYYPFTELMETPFYKAAKKNVCQFFQMEDNLAFDLDAILDSLQCSKSMQLNEDESFYVLLCLIVEFYSDEKIQISNNIVDCLHSDVRPFYWYELAKAYVFISFKKQVHSVSQLKRILFNCFSSIFVLTSNEYGYDLSNHILFTFIDVFGLPCQLDILERIGKTYPDNICIHLRYYQKIKDDEYLARVYAYFRYLFSENHYNCLQMWLAFINLAVKMQHLSEAQMILDEAKKTFLNNPSLNEIEMKLKTSYENRSS